MTWQEFKTEVDRQLKEQGISEDTMIRFIDVTYPNNADDIKAFLEDELLPIVRCLNIAGRANG